MTQQPLIGRHEPRGGLWSKVKDPDGNVHDGAWRTAIALLEHVGTCRCGGQLKPGEPDTSNRRRTFYPATCVQCDHEVSACGPPPVSKPKKGAA